MVILHRLTGILLGTFGIQKYVNIRSMSRTGHWPCPMSRTCPGRAHMFQTWGGRGVWAEMIDMDICSTTAKINMVSYLLHSLRWIDTVFFSVESQEKGYHSLGLLLHYTLFRIFWPNDLKLFWSHIWRHDQDSDPAWKDTNMNIMKYLTVKWMIM